MYVSLLPKGPSKHAMSMCNVYYWCGSGVVCAVTAARVFVSIARAAAPELVLQRVWISCDCGRRESVSHPELS